MTRERAVALVATGDELILGAHADSNSGVIARRLLDLGFEPRRFVVLGDDEDGLVHELLELAAAHGVIILTGGLGPTLDDVTRHACARAAGVALESNADVLRDLKALFASRGRPFAAANERQALFPRGSRVLPNAHGTAAGFELVIAGARVFALPGPPREMMPMLEESVLPRLAEGLGASGYYERRSLYLFGLPESTFADMCGAWMSRDENPLVGVTAQHGVLSVSLRAEAPTRAAATAVVEARAGEMRARFGEWLFSDTDAEPHSALGRVLLERKVRVAIAESCTGGLASEKLTRVPGISAVFERGLIAYSNGAKTALLGVEPALLAAHGAVSGPVAEAMALGAARSAGADFAVSITGVAGPDGGTESKPVGLVWFGLYARGGVASEERRFVVRERGLIREFAANTALELLRRAVIR
ncbi:MAG: CinA family nicotinamide mononucleotide deamidase-related protein [Planctomycetes bacterium]|nr:CinA family nicotinamide mononucleotide deamidase-related protein [Planctomycetota bacterium]